MRTFVGIQFRCEVGVESSPSNIGGKAQIVGDGVAKAFETKRWRCLVHALKHVGPRPRRQELRMGLHETFPQVTESLNLSRRVRTLEVEERLFGMEDGGPVEFVDRSRKCRTIRG